MKPTFLFIFIFLSFYLNGSTFNDDLNYFSPTVVYGESSSVVGGHVNVISGDFVDFGRDLVIPGPVPLKLERNYASSVFRQDGGPHYSWHFNYDSSAIANDQTMVELGNRHNKIRLCKLTVLSLTGAQAFFYKKVDGRENRYTSKVSSLCYEQGFSNTCQGYISGQTSLKNLSFTHEHKSDDIILYEGDGTQLTYKKKSNYDIHVIDSIRAPNGNKTTYSDYQFYKSRSNKWFGPKLIKTTNETGSQIFGQITISYPKHDESYQNYIYTSNHGRSVKYRFRVHKGIKHEAKAGMEKFYWITKDKFCLESVESDTQPTITYSWEYAGKDGNGFSNERYRIRKKSLPDSREIEIDYYTGSEFLNNKVKALKAPIGLDKQLVTAYRFKYDEPLRKTSVYNANNCLSDYFYTECHRLSAITRYMKGQKFSTERFEWGKQGHLIGNLCLHWFENADGSIKTCLSYSYDSNGNAIQETLSGNLTGKCDPSIEIDYSELKPIDRGQEYYTVYREYSQEGMNLLTREIDGSKTVELKYLAGTNLVSEKRTFVDHYQIEENFEYDGNKVLIKQTYRNGSSYKITKITPSTSPIVGLPEIVEEYYEENSQLHLLRRIVSQFNCDGKPLVTKIYDSNGNFAYQKEWKYDSHGNILFEVNPLGQITTRKYDANDNLINEEGPDPTFFKTYEYDFMNRLIAEKIHTSAGKVYTKRFGYDLVGNKLWESDIYDQRTHYVYDDLNRLSEIVFPDGHRKYFEYDINNNVIKEIDENGYATTKKYNSRNQVIVETYSDQTNEVFTYDLTGRLVETIGRNGSRTCFSYDGLGRIIQETCISSTGEELSTITKTYDALNLLSETDPNGVKTSYFYDGASRLIRKKQGDIETLYNYDSLGRVSETIQDCRVTCFEYDLLDRVIQQRVEDLSGSLLTKVEYMYDCRGNKVCVTRFGQAGPSQTLTDYDCFDRIVKETDPEGHETITVYDDTSNQSEQTDPNGVITIILKDSRGRLIQQWMKDTLGQIVENRTLHYDPAGNLIEQIDRALPTTREFVCRWEYDCCGREISCIEGYRSQEQKLTITSYHPSGLKESVTKPDGVKIHYLYDGLDRLICRKSSDQSIHDIFSYDANGNLLFSQDLLTGLKTERVYDSNSRLTTEMLANGAILHYHYDLLGRVIKMTLPDQSKIEYTYDAGNMQSVKRIDSSDKELYRHTYDAYDLSCRLCEETLIGNGGKVTYNYNGSGRPTAKITQSWKATIPPGGYDSSGNLINWTLDDPQGRIENHYTYNALDQLTQETGMVEHSYRCDALSTRLDKDEKQYQINGLNQVTLQNDVSYHYDLNGNRIKKTTTADESNYIYDALNRLIQVDVNGTKVSYSYDTFNRRISRNENGKQESYLYKEMEEIGTVINNEITELKVTGPKQCIAIELKGKVFAALVDLFGNLTGLISPESGETLQTYRYGAFGTEQPLDLPWGYRQKRHDPLTKLVYFGYRDYDMEIGTWSTPDPLGFADGPNLYAYVHHNPIMLNDPDGRFSIFNFGSNSSPDNQGPSFWNSCCTGVSNFVSTTVDYTCRGINNISRGFLDDMTWGLSSFAFGEHYTTSWFDKACYGIGTGMGLVAGCFYGSTEAKVANYGLKTFKYCKNSFGSTCAKPFKPFSVISETSSVKQIGNIHIGKSAKSFMEPIQRTTNATEVNCLKHNLPKEHIWFNMSPFKNSTATEIHHRLIEKGFTIQPTGRSLDQMLQGKGHYFNPVTKRKYSIDPQNVGRYAEPNHIDIMRSKEYKGPLGKKRMAYLDD